MATQQSIPQSIEQSKLAVVPFPAPKSITQAALKKEIKRFSNGEK